MFKKGLILGKFMPFHKGHQALIDFGFTVAQHLEVVIVEKAGETIPLHVRKQWIETIYGNRLAGNQADGHGQTLDGSSGPGGTLQVSCFCHDLPHDGRFLEKDMALWCQAIHRAFPDVDVFISSEAYGEVLANHMGISHVLFEPARSSVPITATEIRENPQAHAAYLPKIIQEYYGIHRGVKMSEIILVTGGARSGKSTFAENLVTQYGDNIAYIATALAFDEGMQDRIEKHRAQRPSHWETLEAFENLGDHFLRLKGQHDGYLLDCITLMVTNLMFKDMPDFDTLLPEKLEEMETMIYQQVADMVKGIRESGARVVLVTNEVGMGIVPENAIARLYRDIAGRVNQQLGHQADAVYLVVCGQALKIKG